jgi:rubrerythrin
MSLRDQLEQARIDHHQLTETVRQARRCWEIAEEELAKSLRRIAQIEERMMDRYREAQERQDRNR